MMEIIAVHKEATRLERERWQPLLEAAKALLAYQDKYCPTQPQEEEKALRAAIEQVEKDTP